MGLIVSMVDGSGRAQCCICHQMIDKGKNNQVVVNGYKMSIRFHRDCITNWEKIKILEAL